MLLDDLAEEVNKMYGANTMLKGNAVRYSPPRLATGVFPIDFISAGGLPLHGSTCFWGGDSGGKTYLALRAVKTASMICWRCMQLLSQCICSLSALKLKTSWVDIEGTFDREWSNKIGILDDSYLVTLADYGEQAIDIAYTSLQADDCAVVVIDSLGALVPKRELVGEAVDSNMGIGPALTTRAVKRLKQRMIIERKREHPCLMIFVNQMRHSLKSMFGSPEIQSGGFAMKHEFSLLFRCSKQSLGVDSKTDSQYYDKERKKYLATKHSVSIHKDKVFILSRETEFIIIKENIRDSLLMAGSTDDLKLILSYAKKYNVLDKHSKGYTVCGKQYRVLGDILNALVQDKDACFMLQQDIIHKAILLANNNNRNILSTRQ